MCSVFSPPAIFPTLSCCCSLMNPYRAGSLSWRPSSSASPQNKLSLPISQFLSEDSDWHSSPVKLSHIVAHLGPGNCDWREDGVQARSGSYGQSSIQPQLGHQPRCHVTPRLLCSAGHQGLQDLAVLLRSLYNALLSVRLQGAYPAYSSWSSQPWPVAGPQSVVVSRPTATSACFLVPTLLKT